MPDSPAKIALETARPRPAVAPPPEPKSKAARIAVASLIGTTIEYYDFAVYGTAAALVLGPAFFPSGSDTASSLAAFHTFAAAFLARPLGVVLFGTIGDRLGRRRALVTS
ncbi:MFS transporter, partial [Streptomyces sp. MCAF7]